MKISYDNHTDQYGAKEIQKFMKKSTVWAMNIAVSIFATAFLLSSALNLFDKGIEIVVGTTYVGETEILPPEILTEYEENRKQKLPEPELPKGKSSEQNVKQLGTDGAVGDFVAVTDTAGREFVNIATFDQVHASTYKIVNTPVQSGVLPIPNMLGVNGNGTDKRELPRSDEFISYDIEPDVDYKHLLKILEYPEMARMAKIEGQVILKILIDPNGKPIKLSVLESDNSILEDAAKKAIMKAKFSPAEQNGHKTHSWIAVPINFVLRHSN